MHRSPDPSDLRSPERRRWLKQTGQLALAGGLLAGGGGWAVLKRRQNLWQVRRERTLMQTSVAVTCLSDDVQAAGEAIEAAFARMAATAAELTRFDPASALSRLNRDGRLALERQQLVVDPSTFQTSTRGVFAVGDINTYPGKKKLILSGFHEAALCAFAAHAHLHPGDKVNLQYTTTSPALQRRLGVREAERGDAVAQPPPRVAASAA